MQKEVLLLLLLFVVMGGGGGDSLMSLKFCSVVNVMHKFKVFLSSLLSFHGFCHPAALGRTKTIWSLNDTEGPSGK